MACTTTNRTQLNDRLNAFPFRNAATAAYDCNVAAVSLALEVKTGDQVTALEARTIGGDPAGGTGTILARRVLRHYGLEAGTDFTTFGGADVQDVRDLLAGGAHVVVYIGYSALVDGYGGQYAGSRTYRGWHAVGLCGLWRSGGARTWLYDPLHDGRTRSGRTYPTGPVKVPFRLIRDGMALYAGEGRASGYAVLL